MKPELIGEKYDRIALWWHQQHDKSEYGVKQLERSLGFLTAASQVLDVGCGAGGRFVRLMEARNLRVTGVDVSAEMIRLAKNNHPGQTFLHQDICTWELPAKYDLILAWDSIFHLPLACHQPVLNKLCAGLAQNGVLFYTFGNDDGELTDQWLNDSFYYSSIGINKNLQLLMNNGLSILHLELDQYPEKHVNVIAARR